MKKLLILCLLIVLSPVQAEESALVDWRSWDGAFKTAKAKDKLVLLDLEAVWCHWCHVMDRTTYRDPQVLELLSEHAIAVKVDQDSRPDLANRYQDYGWPATIIFDSEGRELARLSGYVNPKRMAAILERLKEDPVVLKDSPENRIPRGESEMGEGLLTRLERRHFGFYDEELGAWGSTHKFINAPVVEYCLARSLAGDARNRSMALKTLDNNLALIDPEWGGAYQYSDSGVWTSPHYEKIMSTQAGNIRVYSLAYSQFQKEEYKAAARRVADYLVTFLRGPNGAFYASQDADLIQGSKAHSYFSLGSDERKKLGQPRIDTHQYARENGLAVEALALFSMVSGERKYLRAALEAANWTLKNRQVEDGGFRHGENTASNLYLGDTLYCGRAFLMLYRATADPKWLQCAGQCADFINLHFSEEQTDGYFTSSLLQTRHRPENVDLSRFANLLHAHTGQEAHLQVAKRALLYFTIEGVTDFFNPGGILLADLELKTAPTHIIIVGKRDSAQAKALFQAAGSSPSNHLRVDFWEPGTPLPPFSEIKYPNLGSPAAFICSDGRCSRPLTKVQEIRDYW